MIYDTSKDGKHYLNYSLRYQKMLSDCGFSYIDDFVHLKTNKKCWVYDRTPEINRLLTMVSDNDRNNHGYSDEEIIDLFKNKK